MTVRLAQRLLAPMALISLSMHTAGCKPKGENAICPAQVAAERADEADTRELPTRSWLQLLVPRISVPDLIAPDDPRTCNDTQITIAWSGPEAAARDPRAQAKRLPPRPLTDADLTFAEGPDDALLIWARIVFFDDGSALGPVALARWVDRGVEVRGLGTLWMHANRPRLRLEPFGDDDQILVADAMRCPAPNEAAAPPCAREVTLLPLINQRFVQAELVEDGAPAGPARISTFERIDTPIEGGWVQRSEIRRALRFRGGRIAISESIRIRECDPGSDMNTCDGEKTSGDERLLTWKDDRFHATGSTWRKVTRP